MHQVLNRVGIQMNKEIKAPVSETVEGALGEFPVYIVQYRGQSEAPGLGY